MRVLSLFDGMSCGRFVLNKLNIPIDKYMASEIDKYAITVAQKNFPDTIQLGDVRGVRHLAEAGMLGEIDLLIGGSPCQNLSFAGKQEGFSVDIHTLDEYKRLVAEGFEFKGHSYLFWEYVWIKELLQPKWWLLENVRMNKKYLKIFDDVMGVKGVFINSALVSAQNRQRYYWCNWQVDQPEDRGLLLRDVLESGAVDREKSYCIDANYYKGGSVENYKKKKRRHDLSALSVGNVNPSGKGMNGTVWSDEAKSPTLTTNKGEGVKITGGRVVGRKINPETGCRDDYNPNLTAKQRAEAREDGKAGCITTVDKDSVVVFSDHEPLTPIECESLQGLPDNYTAGVSNSQRYRMLGNGWQCDTILHIFTQGVLI